MAAMRVLHVINGLGTGGAERSLTEMLPLMRDAGVDSTIACLQRKPEGVHSSVEDAGFRVHTVGATRATALRRLRWLIDDVRPDVLHTTIFEADVLGRLAAAGKPCKVLSSLVNTTYDGVRVADAEVSARKLRAVKILDRLTARHLTDHFHAISGPVRDSAVRHLGIDAAAVTVVERGRDAARLGEAGAGRRSAVRKALGLDQDAEVVLNIGRQEPQKAQHVLLEAVATLASTRPRLVLLQAGRRGKATAQLREAATDPRLGGRVRFLGHRDDVGDLLAAADVFAFPSVYEGLGGSVLEAMAVGVPIVVSDAPALVDVVESGRGGLVSPVGDAASLAAAIARLLDQPTLAADLSREARAIFDDRFSLERSAGRMVDLYRRITVGGE